MAKRIRRVHGNVKCGADVELGDRTLIVGPSGSGKSTVVNIVELALTGRVGDVAGRVDIAREADVLALAQKMSASMEAHVVFDDGSEASYRVEGTPAKARKAERSLPAGVDAATALPVRELREALTGSPLAARRFLVTRAGVQPTLAEIEQKLPEAVLPAWKQLAALAASEDVDGPADVLVFVSEKAAANRREALADARASREAAKLVVGGRAQPPTDAEVEAAGAKLDVLRARRSAGRPDAERVRLRDALAASQAEVDRIADRFEAARKRLEGLPAPSNAHVLLSAMLPVVEASRDGTCVVCDGPFPAAAEVAAKIRARVGTGAAAMRERAAAEVEVRQLKGRAVDALAALDAAQKRLDAVPEGPVPEPVDPAAEEAARRDYEAIIAARDGWKSARQAEETAVRREAEAGAWGALAEACTALLGTVVDTARAAFVARVQKYLPREDVFDLRLHEGDRAVARFGLVRDGMLHTALSGAEWARVVAALASACTPEGVFACIIPEERAYDPATLARVMSALSRSPHQIILTSTVMPKVVPDGWTIVERGEGARRKKGKVAPAADAA